jgi:hypothetical protein
MLAVLMSRLTVLDVAVSDHLRMQVCALRCHLDYHRCAAAVSAWLLFLAADPADELVELVVQNGGVDVVVPLLTIADKAEPTVHQRCGLGCAAAAANAAASGSMQ